MAKTPYYSKAESDSKFDKVTAENIETALGETGLNVTKLGLSSSDSEIVNVFSSIPVIKSASGATRFYLVPEINTTENTSDFASGIKMFTTNYVNDQTNYADFGIYALGDSLRINSKRNGTWSKQLPVIIGYQDNHSLAVFDFENKRIALGDDLIPQDNVDISQRLRVSGVLTNEGIFLNANKNTAGTNLFSITRQSGNHIHLNSLEGIGFGVNNGNPDNPIAMFLNASGRLIIGNGVDDGSSKLQVYGTVTFSEFKKAGGSANQILLANGGVKSTSDYIPKDGASTINDIKTFTSPPVVPDATESNQAVNLGQLNTKVTGATGSYTTADGKTVTVTNGLITSIE